MMPLQVKDFKLLLAAIARAEMNLVLLKLHLSIP